MASDAAGGSSTRGVFVSSSGGRDESNTAAADGDGKLEQLAVDSRAAIEAAAGAQVSEGGSLPHRWLTAAAAADDDGGEEDGEYDDGVAQNLPEAATLDPGAAAVAAGERHMSASHKPPESSAVEDEQVAVSADYSSNFPSSIGATSATPEHSASALGGTAGAGAAAEAAAVRLSAASDEDQQQHVQGHWSIQDLLQGTAAPPDESGAVAAATAVPTPVRIAPEEHAAAAAAAVTANISSSGGNACTAELADVISFCSFP